MKLCPVCNSQLPDNQEVPELVPLDYHDDALALSIKRRIAAEEKLRWIPVSERLPEVANSKVAVIWQDGDVTLCHTRDVAELIRGTQSSKEDYITHWMPLPNPPQEVE